MANQTQGTNQRSKGAFFVGVLVILLAIVGTATLVYLSVDGVRNMLNGSEERAKYEEMLAPVVMNDPSPFDDVSKADMSQLIDIAIWSLLHSNPDPNRYEQYSQGDQVGMFVPQEEIAQQFQKMFGTDVAIVHGTVNGGAYDFTYEVSRQGYVIPLTGVLPTYTPKIYEVEESDKTVVLTVGYIGNQGWQQDEAGNVVTSEPDKYMKITLRQQGDGYYISAIQATQTPETVSFDRTATTAAPVTTTQPQTTAQPMTESQTETTTLPESTTTTTQEETE